MATVSMAGTKIPLFFIAKGKTKSVEQTKLGEIAHHMSTHSEEGWMDQDAFDTYLMWLRQQYYDDDPLYLIVDCFPIHINQHSIEIARSLNINLLFIPPGMTDKFQPLDRQIFGCLKAWTKSQITRILVEETGTKIGIQEAVQHFIWAWERLSSSLIIESWSIYNDDE